MPNISSRSFEHSYNANAHEPVGMVNAGPPLPVIPPARKISDVPRTTYVCDAAADTD